ncbi:MAG: DUF1284 domain-containing protein [Methanosarcinaceae archaeon]|nr:DUF1284 domain-containing protein [Methanosarcinaceae archaeon]
MQSEQNGFKIRAHHLFCMQGFQGYGYSPAFVSNMREVVSALNREPCLKLELVSGCDDICACCPNRLECSRQASGKAGRIKGMDHFVLEKLGLGDGTVLEAGELFRLVHKKLRNASCIEAVCGNCGWRDKCLWYLQKNG